MQNIHICKKQTAAAALGRPPADWVLESSLHPPRLTAGGAQAFPGSGKLLLSWFQASRRQQTLMVEGAEDGERSSLPSLLQSGTFLGYLNVAATSSNHVTKIPTSHLSPVSALWSPDMNASGCCYVSLSLPQGRAEVRGHVTECPNDVLVIQPAVGSISLSVPPVLRLPPSKTGNKIPLSSQPRR